MSSQAQKKFSLCLRFKTPHFKLEASTDPGLSPVYGSLLSLTSLEPLLFWPALDCDVSGYSGCTEARKEAAGRRWGRGKDSLELTTGTLKNR